MRIIIVLVSLIIIGTVGFYGLNRQNQLSQSQQQPASTGEDSKEESESIDGYAGRLVAGNATTPYLEFEKADYDKAVVEGKTIFLDFYASWCPVCRGEAPGIEAGFNSLDNENVIGFRVNFDDSDTDSSERTLAEELDVPNQYTKVVLKNGQEIKRTSDTWDSERVISELSIF